MDCPPMTRRLIQILAAALLLCPTACGDAEPMPPLVERLSAVDARCEQHRLCLSSDNAALASQLSAECPTRPVDGQLAVATLEQLDHDALEACSDAVAAVDACALALDCHGYGIFRGADRHCGADQASPCCHAADGTETACPAFGHCQLEVAAYLSLCASPDTNEAANVYNDALARRR